MSDNAGEIASNIIDEILGLKPSLRLLATAPTLSDYYKPVLEWKCDKSIFPYTKLYISILYHKINDLYGSDVAEIAVQALEQSFYVNTAPHLSLPRGFDKDNYKENNGNNINTLIFQSQIVQAAMDATIGRSTSLILATGRVAAQNINSAAYLQIADTDKKFRLISQKKESISQLFLPSIENERIELLEREISKFLPYATYKQKERMQTVTKIFNEVNTNFADQITRANSYIYSNIFENSGFANPITVETECIELSFFKALLTCPNSIVHRIFKNHDLKENFLNTFCDIQTGWKLGENCFVKVHDKKISNHSYQGEMSIEAISKELEKGTIYPTNVLLYFSIITEAGLLCIGGMNQIEYGTTIRDRTVSFLSSIGEYSRANRIQKMPTDRAIVTPCIALTGKKNELGNLSSYSDELCDRISIGTINPDQVMAINGMDSLKLSALALYPFITGKSLPNEYLSSLLETIPQMTTLRLWPNRDKRISKINSQLNL